MSLRVVRRTIRESRAWTCVRKAWVVPETRRVWPSRSPRDRADRRRQGRFGTFKGHSMREVPQDERPIDTGALNECFTGQYNYPYEAITVGRNYVERDHRWCHITLKCRTHKTPLRIHKSISYDLNWRRNLHLHLEYMPSRNNARLFSTQGRSTDSSA